MGFSFRFPVCLFQFQQGSRNGTEGKETFSSPLVNALPVGTQPNAPLLVSINQCGVTREEIAAAGYLRPLSVWSVKRNKVGERGIKEQKTLEDNKDSIQASGD